MERKVSLTHVMSLPSIRNSARAGIEAIDKLGLIAISSSDSDGCEAPPPSQMPGDIACMEGTRSMEHIERESAAVAGDVPNLRRASMRHRRRLRRDGLDTASVRDGPVPVACIIENRAAVAQDVEYRTYQMARDRRFLSLGLVLREGGVAILEAHGDMKRAIRITPSDHAEAVGVIHVSSKTAQFSLECEGREDMMIVNFWLAAGERAPRSIRVRFAEPPTGVPAQLVSRKPRLTATGAWVLDFNGRLAVRSVKNCVLVDDDNVDFMMVVKASRDLLCVAARPEFPPSYVFCLAAGCFLCSV